MSRWEPDLNIRRGRSVVSNLRAHLVFTTKYRKAVFTSQLLDACEITMRQVCDDFDVTLTEFNGEKDHVHLLVHYPPTVELSKLVNSLKGVSSRILRRDHPNEIRQLLWGDHLRFPILFRRLLRRRPTRHHPRLHRKPKTTHLTRNIRNDMAPPGPKRPGFRHQRFPLNPATHMGSA